MLRLLYALRFPRDFRKYEKVITLSPCHQRVYNLVTERKSMHNI